jgi:hypothetical protein
MLSGGPDGDRVEVVSEDRPGGPGPGAAVASEAAAAQAVAAFEVADAALDADPEARQPAVGASGAGGLAAGDEYAVGAGQILGDADREEAAVERELAGVSLRRCSSAAVAGSRSGSFGDPISLAIGTIRPRAPRRVFSQTSASWMT